ncbi:MAG: filamentous hemagglutinin N-terminal domain-containing protein [Gammaproteobacteria bacterium]|nr:filamentous hemagglutinin N-terminal domain-containing protein [Gammaproteobacteria bacterium]
MLYTKQYTQGKQQLRNGCTHKIVKLLFISNTVLLAPSVAAEVILDGSMGNAQTIEGPDYNISAELGQIHGSNLFHSFSEFTINTNESANFSGPDTIQNVISRVTGNNATWIDGSINSSMAGANFYFINPNGLLFGANASLNISGSFYASSANYLALAQDGHYNATHPENSVLSVAAPTAFGFLDGNVGSISLDATQLRVDSGREINLSGGHIRITGSAEQQAQLQAPNGVISLNSVASIGEVPFASSDADTDARALNAFESVGRIDVNNAWINTQGSLGGTIVIRGGRLEMNNSTTYSSTNDPTPDTDLNLRQDKGTLVSTRDTVVLSNASRIGSNAYGTNAPNARGVRVDTHTLELNSQSSLESTVYPGSHGNTDGVTVNATDVLLNQRSYIRSNSYGPGRAGGVTVNGDSVTLRSGSFLNATAWATGETGGVTVNSDILNMDASYISTTSFGSANAADIAINSTTFNIRGVRTEFQGLFANTLSEGTAGDININVIESIHADHYARIEAGSGWGGTGHGGHITVTTPNLVISDGSYISSSTFFGGGGNSGDVSITSEQISIIGVEQSSSPFQKDFTGIQTAAGPAGGNGGRLQITTDQLTIKNRGNINTATYGTGRGGDLHITAQNIEVLNGGQINSGAFGSGNGGDISIETENLLVSGVHPDRFNLFGDTNNPNLAVSGINSQAVLGGGNAGDIHIHANTVELADSGRISTDTYGPGQGGLIHIEAKELNIHGQNQTLKTFLEEIGSSADVNSRAGLHAGTKNFYRSVTGNAGEIRLDVNSIRLDQGIIASFTNSNALGGNINITTDFLSLQNHSLVTAESRFTGDTGDININARQIDSRNSDISTMAQQADGGNINIHNNQVLYLKNSSLSAAVAAANGNGGNIHIDTRTLAMQKASIETTAVSGNGGNITISAQNVIQTMDSVIDASSQTAVNGVIQIQLDVELGKNLEIQTEKTDNTPFTVGTECDNVSNENYAQSRFSVSADSFVYGITSGIPYNPTIYLNRHDGNKAEINPKTGSESADTASLSFRVNNKPDCMT